MLKLSTLSFLLASLVSYSAFSAFVFEFDNQTKETIHVGVGTDKEPPKAADYELKGKQKFPGKDAPALKLNPADGIEVIVRMPDGKQFIYQIAEKALKAGKNVKLKYTSSFFDSKKTKVESQFATNNVSDSDIKIIAELDKDGKKIVKEEKKPESAPAKKPEESKPAKAEKPAKADEEHAKADEHAKDADNEGKAKTDEEESGTKKDADESTPAEEEKPAKPAKPKPTITPVQVLEVSASQKGDNRDAKILGVKFASTIKTATSEPESGMPASMREDEWKKVKAAQREITASFEAQELIWKKVGTSAKKILERKKITDADEQKELAEEVLDLIKLTYKQVKARFVYPEGEKPVEKPAETPADDEPSPSSED